MQLGSANGRLLLVGLVFHLIYLWSIFDIYFRSPLVHGMEPHATQANPPARRLVLFVADGLRADRAFETTPLPFEIKDSAGKVDRIPFLRSVVKSLGRFGVSHTRVPTESRPGHVAVIAGFYEDVSAVTKGWKMNPVEFDSLFNQSRRTWSFGSPDILPMFKYGAADPNKIVAMMYSEEEEDFARGDAKELDRWVFDRVEELFTNATTNQKLHDQLQQDKLVFFLHLLGLDTNGHAHRPHSPEYVDNIRYVDKHIEELTSLFQEYYKDDRTAFIFTSDHGMSNIGNHGDGNPDNTRTPLVAWGAGISPPEDDATGSSHDAFSADWDLHAIRRCDVLQADIAPLMASLIGVPFPMNSVGKIPLDFLGTDETFKALSLSTNARQIFAQYQMKRNAKASLEPFFKDFEPLKPARSRALFESIDSALNSHDFVRVRNVSSLAIDLSIEGLRYFQTYDWLFLRSLISAGYLGWIFYSAIFVVEHYVLTKAPDTSPPKLWIGSILYGCFVLLFQYKQSPAMYYAYAFFPVYFWTLNVFKSRILFASLSDIFRKNRWWHLLGMFLLYVVALECLVVSYFYREILSVYFIVTASLYAWFLPTAIKARYPVVLALQLISSVGCSIFLLLPVNMAESPLFFNAGGLSVVLVGAGTHWYQQADDVAMDRTSFAYQFGLVVASIILVNSSHASISAKEGLPSMNQYLSWTVLLLALGYLASPWFRQTRHFRHRLVQIFLAFAPTMIFLAISYESLFYSSFFMTTWTWLEIERLLYSYENMDVDSIEPDRLMNSGPIFTFRSLDRRDVRLAIQFLFFINVAFFGTGNIASVASFTMSSVYRLLTVFQPFAMGFLLVLKILSPFFILSAVYGVLSSALDLPPFSLFLLSLSMTDIMTLNFFFLVRDDGSWLEIGTSISHFVIACMFEVFSVILFLFSWVLVGSVFIPKKRVKSN